MKTKEQKKQNKKRVMIGVDPQVHELISVYAAHSNKSVRAQAEEWLLSGYNMEREGTPPAERLNPQSKHNTSEGEKR